MNYGSVTRPKADEKRIHSKDEFELCYLRHKYLRKTNYNPTEIEMTPYMGVVEKFVKSSYFTYMSLFRTMGMDYHDLVNIGRVHVVSYIGLFSIERNEKKRKDFENVCMTHKFREPNEKDIQDKNKADFTSFFKQRMEDMIRICKQKSRNVRGKNFDEFTVFVGPNKPPKYLGRLLKDHESLGYKKLDCNVFKSIRRKASVNFDATLFEFGGLWYVAIPNMQTSLSIDDFSASDLNPYNNTHNRQPDDILEEKQSAVLSKNFNNIEKEERISLIINFIEKNKKKRQYREEVATARKILKSLGA